MGINAVASDMLVKYSLLLGGVLLAVPAFALARPENVSDKQPLYFEESRGQAGPGLDGASDGRSLDLAYKNVR
jgi:hypothetical protein